MADVEQFALRLGVGPAPRQAADGSPVLEYDDEAMVCTNSGVRFFIGETKDLGAGNLYVTNRCAGAPQHTAIQRNVRADRDKTAFTNAWSVLL